MLEAGANHYSLIQNWTQAFWETNPDGFVVADSPSWREYTGQTLDEWLGYGWLSAIHPDDRSYAERQWRDAVAARRLVDAEFRLSTREGGWRWTNVRAAPVLDPEGRIEKWVGMNIAITDRKRVEAALRASEARFQALIAASPVPFLVLSPNPPDFTITAANDAFLAVARTTREQLVGMLMFDAFTDDPARPEADGPRLLRASLNRVLATRRTDAMPRIRYDPQMPDGSFQPNWWLPVNAPILDASGEVSAIIHQATRVTEQYYVEQAARESEERQAFLLKLSDTVRPLAGSADVQGETTCLLREELNAGWCYYVDWDLDRKIGLVLRDSASEGLPSLVGAHDVSDAPEFLQLLADGIVRAVSDYANYEQLPTRIRQKFVGAGFRSMMMAPLVKEGRLIATLIVGDTDIRKWSTSEASLLVDVAERTWAAIERAHTEQALRESEEREAFQLQLSDALASLTDPAEIQAEATRRLAEQLDVGWCYFNEFDERGTHATVLSDFHDRNLLSMTGVHDLSDQPDFLSLMKAGAVLDAPDIAASTVLTRRIQQEYGAHGMKSALGVPLHRHGRLAAVLLTADTRIRHWTSGNVELLRNAAERTWSALERARIGEVLRGSEERFRLIVETAHDYAIFTIDQRGIVTSWPAGAANVFGWSEAEMLGQSVERTFVPEDLAAGVPRWERETASREGVAPDAREHLRKDGRRIFIDGSVRPFTTDGLVNGYIKICQDITERQEAEQALRESEERFRQFGEASRDVLWIRNADTLQWVYLSPAFDEIYGLPREQALSGDNLEHWLQLIVPDDREDARRNIERVSGGVSVLFEFRIRRRSDGAIRWLRETDFPLLDATGRVQGVGGIGRDVTDEKETAERMQVLVAELQHRTRNLIGVVRSVADRTVESAASLKDFQKNFRARLGALARVNGLLSRLNEHDRITFDELIRTELSGHGVIPGSGPDDQVTLDGPVGIRLRSATVQTFALALHELATNAVKYGALSKPDGRLAVTWRLIEDDETRLRVDWRETGIPIDIGDGALPRFGYGRELIERALPYQLQAETSYELGRNGVRCAITLPISKQHGISDHA